MSLSERERQILDEIERGFIEDDAASTRSDRMRRYRTRAPVARSTLAAIGVLIGLSCGVLGVVAAGAAGVVVAVLGFALAVTMCTMVLARRRRQ